MNHSINNFLYGDTLYGDDFSNGDLEAWVRDESTGYETVLAGFKSDYSYSYHALDTMFGFRYLPARRIFYSVLGLGAAYAHEYLPILVRIRNITIIDPSAAFARSELKGVPMAYIKPSISGKLPFSDYVFDLITCFSVFHHICNVSFVFSEIVRCCRKDGFILVREPIVSMREPIYSMDDWVKPKKGLTKRERGIPLRKFRNIISQNRLTVLNEQLIMFPPIARLYSIFRKPAYNSNLGVFLDRIMCHLFRWNERYHSYGKYNKFRPTAVYYVLQKWW